jgi:hypothetical protein
MLAMLAAHRGGQESAFTLWRAFVVERWFSLFIDPKVLQPATKQSPSILARDHVSRPDKTQGGWIDSRSRAGGNAAQA